MNITTQNNDILIDIASKKLSLDKENLLPKVLYDVNLKRLTIYHIELNTVESLQI